MNLQMNDTSLDVYIERLRNIESDLNDLKTKVNQSLQEKVGALGDQVRETKDDLRNLLDDKIKEQNKRMTEQKKDMLVIIESNNSNSKLTISSIKDIENDISNLNTKVTTMQTQFNLVKVIGGGLVTILIAYITTLIT